MRNGSSYMTMPLVIEKKREEMTLTPKDDLKPYINFLRAIASEERIEIIKVLLAKEMCVSEV